MSEPPSWSKIEEAAREHLETEAKSPTRRDRYDMEDGPDLAVLAPNPILHRALQYLEERLLQLWTIADAAAIKHRRDHQNLARVAVFTGTAAIVFAVFLLAIQQTWPSITRIALWLEALAAVSAAVAVSIGLWAKYHRRWLVQRYKAERLRMLKFRALGAAELWTGDWKGWTAWVDAEATGLESDVSFEDIKDWAEKSTAEVTVPPIPGEAPNPPFLVPYYQAKRINYQGEFFRNRSEQRKLQVQPFQHWSLRLFVVSLGLVAVHFITDLLVSGRAPHGVVPRWIHNVEIISIWAVTLAAVLPILGLGMRAWTGALEHSRSAALFKAKHQALEDVEKRLLEDQGDLGRTCKHIANVEHFLEEEHREWLRLLIEAEWFV